MVRFSYTNDPLPNLDQFTPSVTFVIVGKKKKTLPREVTREGEIILAHGLRRYSLPWDTGHPGWSDSLP